LTTGEEEADTNLEEDGYFSATLPSHQRNSLAATIKPSEAPPRRSRPLPV